MMSITQTITGFPHGNCEIAALCSVLELDIESELATTPTLAPDGNLPLAVNQMERRLWLATHGVELVHFHAEDLSLAALRGWHLCVGPSAQKTCPCRGTGCDTCCAPAETRPTKPGHLWHTCVGRGGEVVWDPNPKRRGLLAVEYVGILAALDTFKEKQGGGCSWTPAACSEYPDR